MAWTRSERGKPVRRLLQYLRRALGGGATGNGSGDKYVSYRKAREDLMIMYFGSGGEGGVRAGLHVKHTGHT